MAAAGAALGRAFRGAAAGPRQVVSAIGEHTLFHLSSLPFCFIRVWSSSCREGLRLCNYLVGVMWGVGLGWSHRKHLVQNPVAEGEVGFLGDFGSLGGWLGRVMQEARVSGNPRAVLLSPGQCGGGRRARASRMWVFLLVEGSDTEGPGFSCR